MLYVTTRSTRDAFTPNRALRESYAPDGGGYMPLRPETLPTQELEALMRQGFSGCVAEVLNMFFGSKLSPWDVDFCIGKNFYCVYPINFRVRTVQLWRGEQRDFSWLERRLSDRLQGVEDSGRSPADWVRIAVRIAVLFGIFSQLHLEGTLSQGEKLDIGLSAGDFTELAAVWYARNMGLAVGDVVLACSESSGIWDLLNYGQLRTDAVPQQLERLLCAALGQEEAARFASVAEQKKTFLLNPVQTEYLRRGLFAAVIGQERPKNVIASFCRTYNRLLDTDTAAAFAAVQDYRARTGRIRPTLLLSWHYPSRELNTAARALGITPGALSRRVGLD